MEGRKDLRNIAIIAHVDHGKTTLVDEMLDQSGTFAGERGEGHVDRVMDSGDIERERGITILAKNTSIQLPGVKLNIVDTPGHMDFGGEVERTLQMVEGFLLLVDAAEGPLPGTRFVLKKALSLGLKPMVLINKIDRKDADIERVEEEIHDLFLDLAECDSHLDFPVLYGSSKLGFVSECPAATSGTMQPLFDAIIKEVPAPKSLEENLQILITNLDYSDYVGRIGIGRVFSSEMRSGDSIVCCKGDNVSRPMKSAKLYQFEGLKRVEVDHVQFGDIVAVAGLEDEVSIGTTLCSQDAPHPIAYVDIDEPTLSMNVGVNTSPFAGREGDKLTSRQIFDRLQRELRTNVALRVETIENSEYFKVSGRGQLHLGVLVETMRREGFEMQISAPRVIFKDVGGKKCEPFELATVNIDAEHQGIVIEKLSIRRGVMQHMEPDSHGRLVLEFKIPSRG
ncbi:GTP-binding protein, partial [bacterium]|nr:GTP-binding protein [bacterium]